MVPNERAPSDGEIEPALKVGSSDATHGDCAATEARARFEKRFATLRAHLALKGFALFILDGPVFAVQRWDRSATFADLDGVAEFARRVGAAS
jgi:hypothetical protein